MKICKECLIEKPLNDFWKNKNYKDGLLCYCIPCTKNKNSIQYKKRVSKKVFPIINEIDGEIWKKVLLNGVSYNYEISNKGRLKYFSKSVARLISTSKKENIYSCHTLYGNGRVKDICTSIHRLVAIHFIPNPHNLPEVNHINCIKNQNWVENLEWVSKKQNSQHALINGLRIFKYGSENKKSKTVLNTETGIFYETGKEACMAHNLSYGTFIHRMAGRLENKTSLIYA